MLPFMRWAGGKRRQASRIARQMPEVIDTYYEPFVGAGAVLLHLLAQGRVQRAVISDTCAPLIAAWRQIKADPEGVLRWARHYENTSADYEVAVGKLHGTIDPESREPELELAGGFLFINAAAYGGVYRVGRKGGKGPLLYNVPFGRRKRLALHEGRVLAASRLLQNVRIVCASFEVPLALAGPGDVVFADPPYVPNRPGGLTRYSGPFGEEENVRLHQTLFRVAARGAHCMLTNHDVPDVHRIYRSMSFETFSAHRGIGNRTGGEKTVPEVLGTIYPYHREGAS